LQVKRKPSESWGILIAYIVHEANIILVMKQ